MHKEGQKKEQLSALNDSQFGLYVRLCLNPKLQNATKIAKKTRINNVGNKLEYNKTAVFSRKYVQRMSRWLLKQGKNLKDGKLLSFEEIKKIYW